jgi:O-antigen ligase
LFCGLALTAKASAEASVYVWFAALAVLWLAIALLPRADSPALTPFGTAIIVYAAWLTANNLWLTTYTSAATYDAAFLVTGFMLGRAAGRVEAGRVFAVALAFALALSAWSLWQRAQGIEPRGRALFETPATFAATLNLVLAPGLVFVAAGRRNAWLVGALFVLAGALIGTASRGGWLSLALAACAAFVMFRRGGLLPRRDSLLVIAGIFAGGYLITLLAPLNWQTAVGTAAASGTARLELYDAAIKGLAHSSWLTGSGYLDFRYVLEAARPTVPSYQTGTTYFVHDDYLQVLLELGVPGAMLLAAIAALPFAQTCSRLSRIAPHERPFLIAAAAATVAMAVHAVVDFPFHISLCLVMYAACGGIVSAVLSPAPATNAELALPTRLVRAVAVAGCCWLLLRPVAAEAAAERAREEWRIGHGESAAHWFEVARRVEPGDWRFHWYAGQFWFIQAQAGNNAAAARLADRAFEAGLHANPREISNLVWRISTHIYLRSLLPHPADISTLRAWVTQAAELAPLDGRVAVHRDLVARFEAQQASR